MIAEINVYRLLFGLLVGGAVDYRLQQAAHFVLEDASFMSLAVANVECRYIIVVESVGVGRLPEEIQTVIKLRFYEELTLKEIAKIAEVNLNTVKARLYRGLKLLKKEF